MIEILIVMVAGLIAYWQIGKLAAPAPRAVSPQLAALLASADEAYTARRWSRAEQAYIRVLKLDHRNLAAYSRLGVIYAAQKNLDGAIECFEIAIRLRPSAVTYQNLALALHENRNFIKAGLAFEKAIAFEPSANRYVGLAKTRKALHDQPGVIAALEQAATLEPSGRVFGLLEQAYTESGRGEEAKAMREKLTPLASEPTVSINGDSEVKSPVHA